MARAVSELVAHCPSERTRLVACDYPWAQAALSLFQAAAFPSVIRLGEERPFTALQPDRKRA